MNEIGITIKKEEDMPAWYTQVVLKSELADYSAIKGCAVIRPLGYSLWQAIMDFFNKEIAEMGVQNAYFPMFIPEEFFHKEAEHVEGFAPEVAWIERKSDNEERLAIRPTSETIMYDSYAKWIRSHRDLPLRINQWANIVRWEVSDVKLFLRSREFLWQEGHCVYETESQCDEEVFSIIEKYKKVSEELLAVPAIIGLKSKHETFPGAKYSFTIESLMPDGKALQAGTSHNLGQGFAKGFNIKYKGRDEKEHYPWQSSWGFSTRLIGSVIMIHSDNKGLVLPPRVAPTKAVIVPIINKKKQEVSKNVLRKANELKDELTKNGINVSIDDREEYSPGFKYNEWELKGIPVRIEFGPRDMENDSCVLVKRNTGEKITIKLAELTSKLLATLENIQQELFTTAKTNLDKMIVNINDYNELKQAVANKNMVLAHHCSSPECEDEIKAETGGITTRCRPFEADKADESATCIKCEKPAAYKILFARNY